MKRTSAADARRAAAHAPFTGRLPVKPSRPAVTVWTRPLETVKKPANPWTK